MRQSRVQRTVSAGCGTGTAEGAASARKIDLWVASIAGDQNPLLAGLYAVAATLADCGESLDGPGHAWQIGTGIATAAQEGAPCMVDCHGAVTECNPQAKPSAQLIQ